MEPSLSQWNLSWEWDKIDKVWSDLQTIYQDKYLFIYVFISVTLAFEPVDSEILQPLSWKVFSRSDEDKALSDLVWPQNRPCSMQEHGHKTVWAPFCLKLFYDPMEKKKEKKKKANTEVERCVLRSWASTVFRLLETDFLSPKVLGHYPYVWLWHTSHTHICNAVALALFIESRNH